VRLQGQASPSHSRQQLQAHNAKNLQIKKYGEMSEKWIPNEQYLHSSHFNLPHTPCHTADTTGAGILSKSFGSDLMAGGTTAPTNVVRSATPCAITTWFILQC
jgi:hypothetical protein